MDSCHSGGLSLMSAWSGTDFSDKADAEQAINTMNGQWLGSRAIRVNWANQKTQTGGGSVGGPGGPGRPAGMAALSAMPPMPAQAYGMAAPMASSMSGSPAPQHAYAPPAPTVSYDAVAAQSGDTNATVYVGNLIPYTTQADLIPLFQGYGYIVEVRMQADRGFAFVKLDSHHNAALAITQLQNRLVHGRPIKCSWGKDKEGSAPAAGGQQQGYAQVSDVMLSG
jgi:nucleolysin TIA-1/TIAR